MNKLNIPSRNGTRKAGIMNLAGKMFMMIFFALFFCSTYEINAQFYQSRSRNYSPRNLNNQAEIQYMIMNDTYYRSCVLMEVEMTNGNGWGANGNVGFRAVLNVGGFYNSTQGRKFFATTYQCGQVTPKHGQRFYLQLKNGQRSRVFIWNDNLTNY